MPVVPFDMIKGLFMRQFLKSDPITIHLSPMTTDIEGNTAETNFDAAIFEGEGVSVFAIPNSEDILHFNVQLTKDAEGEWKITSHTREFSTSRSRLDGVSGNFLRPNCFSNPTST